MSAHRNSLASFAHGLTGPFSARSRAILDELHRAGPGTDRELMARLGFTDGNSVKPRISELCESGVLEECGSRVDPITQKSVRVVRVRQTHLDPKQIPLVLTA